MTTFSANGWLFELKTPEYEIPVFGGKVGELKLVLPKSNDDYKNADYSLENIKDYLITNKILACTFRGKEDLKLVQYLNSLEFKFIATYNTICCDVNEFREISIKSDLETIVAQSSDFDGILEIESNVFDYSTYQIDPFFSDKDMAYRNVLRVKSYFNNPNHISFILKKKGVITGFLQFILDERNKIADCVNGAIHPMFQGIFIGPKLYSDAFKSVFELGAKKITGGYCSQNIPVSKIFKACNFKISDQEIHLRLNIPNL